MSVRSVLKYCSYPAVFFFLFPACTEHGTPSADDVLRIGVIAEPLSPAIADGATIAVAELNAGGGVLIGRRRHPVMLYRMTMEQNAPEYAVGAALTMINRDSVVAIIGPTYSRNCIPVSAMTESAGILYLPVGATSPALTSGSKYVFRLGHNDSIAARVLASAACSAMGRKRIGIVYQISDGYSAYLADRFALEAGALGARIVATESYTADRRSIVGGLLKKILQQNVDALFLPNYGGDILEQRNLLRKMDRNIMLFGSDMAYTRSGDSGMPDIVCIGPRPIEAGRATDFVRAWKEHSGLPFDTLAAYGYDAVRILVSGVTIARSFEPADIRTALHGAPPYRGITNDYQFDTTGTLLAPQALYRVHAAAPVLLKTVSASAGTP